MLGKGVSPRVAQAQLKKRFREHVGEGTLRGWLKRAEVDTDRENREAFIREGTSDIEQPDVPAALPEDVDTSGDILEETKRQYAEMLRMSKRASSDGNHAAAQRFGGEAVKLKLLLARLQPKADADAVTHTRAELAAAEKKVRERFAALAADLERTNGLVCSGCGQRIRIQLAKGE